MLSETLQQIAVAAAQPLALEDVLRRITSGLAETAGLALARTHAAPFERAGLVGRRRPREKAARRPADRGLP